MEGLCMYDETQYKNDLLFIEKIEGITSKRFEFYAYIVGQTACLAAHVLYLILFAMNGIRGMAIFNIFSVLFYLAGLFLVPRLKERIIIVYASVIEIIIHASVATLFVGSKPDFLMFLLMIIPLVFLMPGKNKTFPFVIMAVSLILYGFLRSCFNESGRAFYDIDSKSVSVTLYVINIVIGFFVLVFVTTIYYHTNKYTESKLRVQNEQLRLLASVDPLTKLSNRRAMNKALDEIHAACREDKDKYVIGIGDIDDFKRVNDSYGHDFGDVVLSTIAEIIKSSLPANSEVARWGGEEFLFAIPASELMDGAEVADKIIRSVVSHKFTCGNREFFVTMTFGVCEGGRSDDVDSVISRADKRLYKGKNSGKNHTEYTD